MILEDRPEISLASCFTEVLVPPTFSSVHITQCLINSPRCVGRCVLRVLPTFHRVAACMGLSLRPGSVAIAISLPFPLLRGVSGVQGWWISRAVCGWSQDQIGHCLCQLSPVLGPLSFLPVLAHLLSSWALTGKLGEGGLWTKGNREIREIFSPMFIHVSVNSLMNQDSNSTSINLA